MCMVGTRGRSRRAEQGVGAFGAVGFNPAVSRLEDREQAEGHEAKRHRREQKPLERLGLDRLQRAVQPLLLPVR
jgi:hypothetical protein